MTTVKRPDIDEDIIKKLEAVIRECRSHYIIYDTRFIRMEDTAGPNYYMGMGEEKVPEGTKIDMVGIFIAREPDAWGVWHKFMYETIAQESETELVERVLYLLKNEGYHELGDLKSDHTWVR